MLDTEPVPHASDGAFDGGVEALNAVGVCTCDGQRIAPGPLALAVVHAQVRWKALTDPAIGRQLVGDEHSVPVQPVEHRSCDGSLAVGATLACFGFAISLNGGDCHHLAGATAPFGLVIIAVALALGVASAFAADVGLIDLHDALESRIIFSQKLTNSMAQEPGGFVRDAELSADDHGRYAFAGGGDQVDRHEPGLERQVSALHGRSRRHAELLLAGSACPGARLRRLPGIRNGAALVADRTMWPARACEVLDALLF